MKEAFTCDGPNTCNSILQKHEMMLYKMVYKPIKQNPFHFLTISWLQLFLGILFQESSSHILKGRSRGQKSESQNCQGLFAHLTDQSQYLRKRMNAAHQTHLPWGSSIHENRGLLLHSLNMVIKKKSPHVNRLGKRKPTSQRGH